MFGGSQTERESLPKRNIRFLNDKRESENIRSAGDFLTDRGVTKRESADIGSGSLAGL